MTDIFDNNFFGMFISIAVFLLARKICSRFKTPLANPLFFSVVFIICFLKIFGIPLEYFEKGGNILFMCLTPATAILAVGIYNKLDILKKYFLPVFCGTLVGSVVSVVSVLVLSKMFGLNEVIINSILPKSVTTAIAVGIAEVRGGNISITSAAVFVAGITGAVLSPVMIKAFRIKNKVAAGLAIGTSSHALGTTKALELGETEGAMSSIAICMAGIITVVICMFV